MGERISPFHEELSFGPKKIGKKEHGNIEATHLRIVMPLADCVRSGKGKECSAAAVKEEK